MVGGFKHGFYFPFHKERDVILPIDEHVYHGRPGEMVMTHR
jgi:hypothetical protein